MRIVDPGRSRVVLVGAPVYDDPLLPDVPQVGRNLVDLAAVLTDPDLGGFPEWHCVAAGADASVERVGDLLEESAAQAEDLLLFYFAGHGAVGPRGELYLCLRGTRWRNPAYSALRFETVRDTFLHPSTRAANRVVILDCCFSGRAIGATLAGPAGATLADELEISGTYTLTAVPSNSRALVRDGEAHTAFTGRLLALLREGSEQAGEVLSFGDIYRHLHARLRAEGLPLPQQRGTATADLLGLVRNRRLAPPNEAAEPVSRARPRASIPAAGGGEAAGLRWAEAALDVAQRTAEGIADERARALAWAHVAVAVTAISPGAAERIARRAVLTAADITDTDAKTSALAAVATILAASMAQHAERVITEITDEHGRTRALPEIVLAMAASDPRRAERIAAGLGDDEVKAWVLPEIARGLADIDPQGAERIADRAEQAAANTSERRLTALALANIARALGAINPERAERAAERAERIAEHVTNVDARAATLAHIARTLAVTSPQRAERIAERVLASASLNHDVMKAALLPEIAWALAAIDPRRAEYIASAAGGESMKAASALAEIARVLAATAPQDAERIAAGITAHNIKAFALAEIARVLMTTAPQDAERIAALAAQTAADIPAENWKVVTLAGIARVWLEGRHSEELSVGY